MILSFDPGEVNVGFCMFLYNEELRKADLKYMAVLTPEQTYEMLELAEGMLKPGQTHTFVIENFRIDQKVRGAVFQWSEMKTVRLIGALEYAARRMNKSKVVLQEPGPVLSQARKWAPFKWPKGHLPDDKSAYCHGAYYMMKYRYIDTVDDILQKGQEKLW